ncbi:hypothetical protein Cgig2_007573 [Carnegiea gigantea]|uniref:Uncharacterized protein n=1 Tax=Carnegiea gigantea TaxID=171969 RepID=A0A9Q1GL64_9CARY|nr:hypothetical protein Cgig2_007573 [Carnegiea gigantea]
MDMAGSQAITAVHVSFLVLLLIRKSRISYNYLHASCSTCATWSAARLVTYARQDVLCSLGIPVYDRAQSVGDTDSTSVVESGQAPTLLTKGGHETGNMPIVDTGEARILSENRVYNMSALLGALESTLPPQPVGEPESTPVVEAGDAPQLRQVWSTPSLAYFYYSFK